MFCLYRYPSVILGSKAKKRRCHKTTQPFDFFTGPNKLLFLIVNTFSPTFSFLIVSPRRSLRTSPFYRLIFFTASTRDHSTRATWKGRQVLDRSTRRQQSLRRTNNRGVSRRSLGNLSQVIYRLRLLFVSFFFFLAFFLSLAGAKC